MEPMCSFSHCQFAIKCSFCFKLSKKGTLMLKFAKNSSVCSQFYGSVQIWNKRNICIKSVKNECNKSTKSGTKEPKNGTKVPPTSTR